MLNCISGRYTPSEGTIRFKGADITPVRTSRRAALGIGRTFQNLALFGNMTVLDNILVGRHHLLRNNFLTGGLYWLAGAQREELKHRQRVEEIIDFLQIQAIRKEPAGTLPYGLRKRVELARAMAVEPELLLLDEPMAGMNLEEKEDMARYVVDLNEEWGITVIPRSWLMSRMKRTMSSVSSRFMPAIGSSSRMSLGLRASARASSTRFCRP
jgi:branched-chain amino acid transport system ATP-binding protein